MNTYETRDGWVLVAAMSDNIWPRLCAAIDAPEWAGDARFETFRQRAAAWEVIEERLRGWFGGRTVRESVDRFSALGIPINAVNTVADAAREPQLHERELLVEVPDPVAGAIHVSGKPIKLSRSDTVVGSAPVPGEHTEDVLNGLLGFTATGNRRPGSRRRRVPRRPRRRRGSES